MEKAQNLTNNIKTQQGSRILHEHDLVEVESKFGFFEIFNDKSIKKGFTSINSHNMDKKYNSKIPFPIIETFLFDNGQISFWNFTDKNGFVLKRSQKKLNKDTVVLYLISELTEYFKVSDPGMKLKKSENQILSDINRFTSLLDQKIDTKLLFNEPEYKYLDKIHSVKFILVHTGSTPENPGSTHEMKNIFDFNKMVNDSSLVSNVLMAQVYLNVVSTAKPLICKYTRKDQLTPKKFHLYTEKPNYKLGKKKDEFLFDQSKISKFNSSGNIKIVNHLHKKDSEEEFKTTHKETELILLNDANLSNYIENTLEPFIKLIEKSKKIFIHEGHFKFIKMNNILFNSEYYAFSFCEKIIAESKTTEVYKEQQSEMKQKMNKIKEKTIPKDLLLNQTERGGSFVGKNTRSLGANQLTNSSLPPQKVFKHYEKITKDAFCFGEFCEYSIPKIFKNLKKNTKIDEINSTVIPKENKFSESDKMHNLPNTLPVFLIKKAYDNPHLVNIVLKAYSIFPADFDKDAAIRELNRIKKEEEEKRKEEEKAREILKKQEEEKRKQKITALGSLNLSSLPNLNTVVNTTTSIETTRPNINVNTSHVKKNKMVITLYTPTPQKFDHINYDTMYSKKFVCNNCYTIYTLIQNFLSNIDETTSQFKSLSKAKDLLLQGDKLKNPYENEDSFTQEQPENLLFQEEKNDFNLKSILKKNMRKIKREARKKNEKRKEKLKIVKNAPTRKDEFKKTFSYALHVNPKLLKLNLVAEKTKNKFFNLIFNELKSEPKNIYQKLGINKPDEHYKNSMKTLRMHMGINSYSYNTNYRELNQLNKKINDEVLKEFINNIHEKQEGENFSYREPMVSQRKKIESKINLSSIKSFRKAIEGRSSLMNQQIELNQTDVDIFLAFKNLRKVYGSPFVSPLKKGMRSKINYLLEEHDDDYDSQESNEDRDKRDTYSDENDSLTNSSYLEDSYRSENSLLSHSEYNTEEEMNSHYNKDADLRQKGNLSKISESKPTLEMGQTSVPVRTSRKHLSSTMKLNSKSTKNIMHVVSHELNSSSIQHEIKPKARTKTRLKTVHCKGGLDIKDKLREMSQMSNIQSQGNTVSHDDPLPSKEDKVITKSTEKKMTKQSMKSVSSSVKHPEEQDRFVKKHTQISTRTGKNSMRNKQNTHHSSNNQNQELSKKITVSSIYYYEWSKDSNKYDFSNNYYYISTPLTKFNEMNIPVTESPLLLTQNMTVSDFIKIGKFENSPLLSEAEVFVYDQFTAVPYKVTVLKDSEGMSEKKKEPSANSVNKGTTGNLQNNIQVSPTSKRGTFVRRGSTAILKEGKGLKCVVLCLNDFFDTFVKYQELMTEIWGCYTDYLDKMKLIFFNFPGQSTTLFSKKAILNNMYYTEFLDRFLFHLVEKNYFDHTYHMILVGFGNGGQVALTYSSFYEKYWDFIHSILLFNPYSENDEFINKSMLEILKIVEGSRNTKLVDFFVKSITVNPKKLIDPDTKYTGFNNGNSINVSQSSKGFQMTNFNMHNPYAIKQSEPNPITMAGYHNITRGYFFNLKINHKEIQTPFVVVHSNQNCFITINNINSIFHHLKLKNYSITPGVSVTNPKTNPRRSTGFNLNISPTMDEDSFPVLSCNYEFSEIHPQNKIRRKLIVVDGSHDIVYDNPTHISNIIHSYMRYLVKNIPFNGEFLNKK